jgi:hypothetical protein
VRRPKTVKTMKAVFDRLLTWAEENELTEPVSMAFNAMLDELHNDDFFGTEGQSDPRGDARND